MVRYILHIRQYTTQLLCMPVFPDFLPRGLNILRINDDSENRSRAVKCFEKILRIRNRKFTKNAIDIRYLCLSISLSKHYNVVSRCIQETLVAFSLLLSFLFYRWLLFSPWLFTLFASTFMDCFTPCCGVAHTSEACF